MILCRIGILPLALMANINKVSNVRGIKCPVSYKRLVLERKKRQKRKKENRLTFWTLVTHGLPSPCINNVVTGKRTITIM